MFHQEAVTYSPQTESQLQPDPQLAAAQVARGIARLFARNDVWCLAEVPLRNGRRADLMGIDARGHVVIVEIKVARGDLLGDAKWADYLDFCDRFYWGVPPMLDRAPLEGEAFCPARCGVIVADGYDGEILRPATSPPLPLPAVKPRSSISRESRCGGTLRTSTLFAAQSIWHPDCPFRREAAFCRYGCGGNCAMVRA
jgi:hypothetical protein